MKISNNLQLTKTGQNNLRGKNKTPEFTEPADTFTFSGTFAGAPDKSAGGWVTNEQASGYPKDAIGSGSKPAEKEQKYPGDAIGFGSGSSSGSSRKFVGAPDGSAGGWVTDDKPSNYPGDAIGFGSGSSSGSSWKFVGAPDRSAGGWVTDDKSSKYPGDAIGFGSGR